MDKAMRGVLLRTRAIGLLLIVILSAVCPGSGAQAMGWDEGFWSWDEVFSRSPEAVRGQLNRLVKAFRQEEGGLNGIFFKWVDNADGEGFHFVGKNGQDVLDGQHMRVSVEGRTNSAGEVETLRVRCRPAQELTADFDEESFQFMRMALMAMFDQDNARQGEALSLLYVYDLRPYLYEKGDKKMPPLRRDVDTVADGLYVKAVTESRADELCLTVEIQGPATDEQIREARRNDQSNRLLDQSIGELVILKECAWELARILPGLQKDEMNALFEQMEVSLSAIRELDMERCSKCEGYAQALDDVMEQMDELILKLRQWMERPETAQGEVLEKQMLEQVNQIKQMAGLIQMC